MGTRHAPPTTTHTPLRRHDRLIITHTHHRRSTTRRNIQPRRTKPRQSIIRRTRIHRRRRRHRHTQTARSNTHTRPRKTMPRIPSLHQRTLRQSTPSTPKRRHTILSALTLRRSQNVLLLDHEKLPRKLRNVYRQRHTLQPRKPTPRRKLRHTQNHPRRRTHSTQTPRQTLPGQPRRTTRLGLRRRLRRMYVAYTTTAPTRRLRHRHRRIPHRARLHLAPSPAQASTCDGKAPASTKKA